MTIMYSDEVLAEMIKLTEKQQNKPLEKEASENDLRIDMSQFTLEAAPEDDGLAVTSFPMMQNVVVAEDNDGLDKEILKEKKKATDHEDIIEQAHPETAYMADGPMGTGVVENQNEQHTKILNTIYKMPTGFHFNTFAELTQDLVVLAERLEAKGDLEAVRKVDETLAAIAAAKKKRSLAATPEKVVPTGMKRPEHHAIPGETYSKTKPPKPGSPGTALVVRPQTDMTKAPGTQMTVRPSGDVVTVQKGQPGFGGPAQLGPGKTPPQLGPGPKGGPLVVKQPIVEVIPPEKTVGPGKPKPKTGPIIDVKPEPAKTPKELGTGKPKRVAPDVKPEPGAKQFRPEKKPIITPPPKKPSRVKNFLARMVGKAKGKGMWGLLAAVVGAGLYGLWQSTKSDWERYLDMAEDEANKAKNAEAKVLVGDIRRRYDAVDEMMSSAEESKSLEVNQYLQIDQLIAKVDELDNYSYISDEMSEAAKGLAALAATLQSKGAEYFEKTVQEKEEARGRKEENIKSLKQWFADHGDADIKVDGEVDDRLKFHIRGFVSNMRKRFGPAFNPKNLSEKNLLDHGNYELLDRLFQIWKYPRAAIGEE